MTVTREQAMDALFALLQTAAPFVTASRRFKLPADVPPSEQPALFMCEPDEKHMRNKQLIPAVREKNVLVYIFIQTGLDPSTVPATEMNNLIDAIDPTSGGVLKPGLHGKQTLGNLVTDCFIEGELFVEPGDLDGQGLARIPIKVIFMQP